MNVSCGLACQIYDPSVSLRLTAPLTQGSLIAEPFAFYKYKHLIYNIKARIIL